MTATAAREFASLVVPTAATAPSVIETQASQDPVRLVEIVDALVRNNTVGVLDQDSVKTRIRPLACNPAAGTMSWELSDAIAHAPLEIELDGYTSTYRLTVEHGVQNGNRLTTAMPTRVRQVSQRWERRQVVTDLHASFNGATALVHDVSCGGLSLRVASTEGLVAGDRLDGVVVQDERGARVTLDCEIKHVSTDLDGNLVCGLEVVGQPARSGAWVQLVNDRLFPGTGTGSQWSEQVWNLYDRCGYLSLSGKNPAQFARLKRAFLSVSRQLDRAPQIACQVVWPNEDGSGLTAALSMVKLYQGSWFPFQLGKVSGPSPEGVPGRKILRDVHLRAYEHVKRDPNLKWIVAYTQVKNHWSRMAHHDLPAEHVASGDACLVRFRALALDCAEGAETTGDVGPASADERQLLADHIAATRPPAYAEALDLVASRLEMTEATRLWKGSRLERDRGVLVARRNGKAVAAAVVETAADGVHLYGLLDVVRVYSLADGGEDAMPALLEAAKAWYRERGKERCVVCLEDDVTLSAETLATMEDMGPADIVVLSATRVPDWLERLYEVTAPQAGSEG